MTKYSYSHDEEEFHGEYDSIEQAVEAAFETLDPEDQLADMTVFVGEIDRKSAGDFLKAMDVETMAEGMAENAYEDCGDVVSDWLKFPCTPLVRRSGKLRRAAHAMNLSEEEVQKEYNKWEAHDQALQDLTSQIRILVNDWATTTGNQPAFWGIKKVKQYYRNMTCING